MPNVIRREHAILCGAVLGLVIAIAGSVERTRWRDDAVARVNGIEIPMQSYELAIQRLRASSLEERTAVLRFLVDEELLVQRAEAVGLLAHDRTIRKAVVGAVVECLNARVRGLGSSSHEFSSFWRGRSPRFLRATSREQTVASAEREFRIRFPDVLLQQLLARLRARGDIQVSEAKAAPSASAIRVNGVRIPADHVARFLDALMENQRHPPSLADLEHAVNRVVDEEMLFQYGLETGLHRSERSVRAVISKTMLDAIAMESQAHPAATKSGETVGTFVERLRAGARIEWPRWLEEERPS